MVAPGRWILPIRQHDHPDLRLALLLALALSTCSLAHSRRGEAPLCADYDTDFESARQLIPPYALANTTEEMEQGRSEEMEQLNRDLDDLVRRFVLAEDVIRICFHGDRYYKPKAIMSAWATYFRKNHRTAEIVNDNEYLYRQRPDPDLMATCDLEFIWAVKSASFFEIRRQQRFGHTIVLEEPWIWRADPVDGRRLWSFAGWDYLNGYALAWKPAPKTRWEEYFSGTLRFQPWIDPRPNGTVLILGQIPTDTAVIGAKVKYGSIDNVYRFMIQEIQAALPDIEIIYRPHPRIDDPKHKCVLSAVKGVTVRTFEDATLNEELDRAAVAVTISSTSAIEAIIKGVPVIALDGVSPIWDVSCHDFADIARTVTGRGCRKKRSHWAHSLAYSMWTVKDIESGEAFEYLTGYDERARKIRREEGMEEEEEDEEVVVASDDNKDGDEKLEQQQSDGGVEEDEDQDQGVKVLAQDQVDDGHDQDQRQGRRRDQNKSGVEEEGEDANAQVQDQHDRGHDADDNRANQPRETRPSDPRSLRRHLRRHGSPAGEQPDPSPSPSPPTSSEEGQGLSGDLTRVITEVTSSISFVEHEPVSAIQSTLQTSATIRTQGPEVEQVLKEIIHNRSSVIMDRSTRKQRGVFIPVAGINNATLQNRTG